jgi:hypothetical protein
LGDVIGITVALTNPGNFTSGNTINYNGICYYYTTTLSVNPPILTYDNPDYNNCQDCLNVLPNQSYIFESCCVDQNTGRGGLIYVDINSISPIPNYGEVIVVTGKVCYFYAGVESKIVPEYSHGSGTIDYSNCTECELYNTSYCPVIAECCNNPKQTIVIAIDKNTFVFGQVIEYNNDCYVVKSFASANGVPVNIYATAQYITCAACEAIYGVGCDMP